MSVKSGTAKPASRAPLVARIVQICASQNDLFGLDDAGIVHQYDFSAKTWRQLAAARSTEASARGEQRARGGEWPAR